MSRIWQGALYATAMSSVHGVLLLLWLVLVGDGRAEPWEWYALAGICLLTGMWWGGNAVWWCWHASESQRQRQLRRWASGVLSPQNPGVQHQVWN